MQGSSTGSRVSVIVPTFNEIDNLATTVDGLEQVLDGRDFEIIIVDDNSPDRTWELADRLAEQRPWLRPVRRMAGRGLSSAVLFGMTIASGDVLVVIDADRQHDPAIMPLLIDHVVQGTADVAIGSRDAAGGSYGTFSPFRRFISWTGAQLARRLLGLSAKDAMSGYFALSRQRYEQVAASVNPRGFKILLEFLGRGPTPRVVEVGYTFGERVAGQTKLTTSVLVSYLLAIVDLASGRLVSATFAAYALVGATGVVVRLAAQGALSAWGVHRAEWFALELSVLSNYVLNNTFTFSSLAHRGLAHARAIALFHLISAQGLLIQLAVSHYLVSPTGLVERLGSWSTTVSAGVGILAATAANYYLNCAFTWPSRGAKAA